MMMNADIRPAQPQGVSTVTDIVTDGALARELERKAALRGRRNLEVNEPLQLLFVARQIFSN